MDATLRKSTLSLHSFSSSPTLSTPTPLPPLLLHSSPSPSSLLSYASPSLLFPQAISISFWLALHLLHPPPLPHLHRPLQSELTPLPISIPTLSHNLYRLSSFTLPPTSPFDPPLAQPPPSYSPLVLPTLPRPPVFPPTFSIPPPPKPLPPTPPTPPKPQPSPSSDPPLPSSLRLPLTLHPTTLPLLYFPSTSLFISSLTLHPHTAYFSLSIFFITLSPSPCFLLRALSPIPLCPQSQPPPHLSLASPHPHTPTSFFPVKTTTLHTTPPIPHSTTSNILLFFTHP